MKKMSFSPFYSLEGEWKADIGDGRIYDVRLPGTLDENGIGVQDVGADGQQPILTRFTRNYTYEGEARFFRSFVFELPPDKRVFMEAERARCLKLFVDGIEIPHFRAPSLSTPHVFEVTGIESGSHEITFLSDNHYSGLPHDDIIMSSAATDETQTNWNGILGYFRLRMEEMVFVESVCVYPYGNELTIKVNISACVPWSGRVSVDSEALQTPLVKAVSVEKGLTELVWENLPLARGVKRWDEYEGNLYELTIRLENREEKQNSEKIVTFGVRDFAADTDGRLALNGRTFFLRGEANCAVFPETGYCPMTVEEWRDILTTYQSYGVNCVRFHSHCPPEAAFRAADEMGMMMQPELSQWNPKDAFLSDESFAYYKTELAQVIRFLANHPSFVMLTLGNELQTSEAGHKRMDELLTLAERIDGTRLYANGSNVHYGEKGCDVRSGFYTAMKYFGDDLRGTFSGMEGHINCCYPSAQVHYGEAMERLRKTFDKPVFGFEVGQFEVLPDFSELTEFHGVCRPDNLAQIRERVKERALLPVWEKYVEASGELAKICYREEIESAMRTKCLSGISLLGLQDFPGQGTALVGMLNSHLRPKPYDFAKPETFRAFFASRLPLVLLPKYTYESTETLEAAVQIANFGKMDIEGEVCCRLQGKDVSGEDIVLEERLPCVICPVGKLTEAGIFRLPLSVVSRPARLDLTVTIADISNTYPLWVYPPVTPACPEGVYETEQFDERAKAVLEAGGTVYLTPPSTKEAIPDSIRSQFTTDFWSVGTFPAQEGGMGQFIEASHPVFTDFPTEFHTNWQWWPMASQRAAVLKKPYRSIITVMDSYAYLRPMTQLLEGRFGKGKLLFSTMGLQNLQNYPEARALLASIYRYLVSEEFAPEQELSAVWEDKENTITKKQEDLS